MEVIHAIGLDVILLLILGIGLGQNLSIKLLGVLLLIFYLVSDGFETTGFDIALLLAVGIGLAPNWAFKIIGFMFLWFYLNEVQAPIWWLLPLVILTNMIDRVVFNLGTNWQKT